MPLVRKPAVAGMFYPGDPGELNRVVMECLQNAVSTHGMTGPKAIIAPHAGYIYSGPIAGSVYITLYPIQSQVKRVVLLGPAHRVPFNGIAGTKVDYFSTPLGMVPVDQSAMAALIQIPGFSLYEEAYVGEHSLEVHLPFLQRTLQDFKIVPLLVGQAKPETVAEVIRALWGESETLVVISSDLSHYHEYSTAQKIDTTTSRAIEALKPEEIGYEQACGRIPIQGLLLVAKEKGLTVQKLDLRNSGDTAGSKDRVVGYGAYHLS